MAQAMVMMLAALLLVFSAGTGSAEDWDRTFGGKNDDFADSVQQTTDSGYILAGGTYSYGSGLGDAIFLKTNLDGVLEWSKLYGGASEDWIHSIWQTKDDAYIAAGFTESYGTEGSADVWLVRVNGDGQIRWAKTFGGEGADHGYGIQQTTDGGYIIAGDTASFGAGALDAWLIKTDTYGNLEWDRTFGGEEDDSAYSVLQTSDGGYIIAGYTWSFSSSPNETDAWVIKTDADGNEMWSETFGGTKSEWLSSAEQTEDGGYILGGYTGSYGGGKGDIWLIRLDADGNELWDRTFGGSEEERSYGTRVASDGGYIISGYTASFGSGGYDIWLIKTDSNGERLWDRLFGGDRLDKCKSVIQSADGGYVLAGNTQSYSVGGFDVWLIKTSEPSALSQVHLESPSDGSHFSEPPTFTWSSDGGSNDAYAVDFSYSSDFKYFQSTYENLKLILHETSWTMPDKNWRSVPSGTKIYWRVRGADLSHEPLTIISSDEAWTFYKD